ncbi:hypothetical protein [Williamsia sp.]|uniref:hypothetical protein n=1 Tax=Williamsia sp. TaxID=1872085 RepID=UPI002F93906A
MADAIRTFKGDIAVTFADKSKHTFTGATAAIFEQSGVLRVTDSDNIERFYSPSHWAEATNGTARKPQRAGTVY